MPQDPLSDVLALVNAQSFVSGGFRAGGEWAIRFPAPDKLKFYAIGKGECWLQVEGAAAPVRLHAGDVLLMASPRPFILASDLALPPVAAETVFEGGALRFIQLGEGEELLFFGGHVRLSSLSGELLIANLPPMVHVRAGAEEARSLRWLVDRLVHEQGAQLPGATFASAQLAQLMFLEALRAYYASDQAALAPGRLKAISDPRIAPALRLMHSRPHHAWQLADLAGAAAMSRTVFSIYFKNVVGISPLAYLTEWRMRLAQHALRDSNSSVSAVAEATGYSSDSAFSTAFKRVTGLSPKSYREQLAPLPSTSPEA